MRKKLLGVLFLFILFAVPVVMLVCGNGPALIYAFAYKNQFFRLEAQMKERFPAVEELRDFRMSFKYITGDREQNGVFIAENAQALMYNLQPASNQLRANNEQSIQELSAQLDKPCYLMLIPSASAVQQKKVPFAYSQILFDQKQAVDEIYHDVARQMTTIDVYPVLRDHQEEYIYYRTQDTLTGMGGYYVYTAAAAKLGVRVTGIENYSIEHISFDYYGALYDAAPYKEISPDRISMYADDSKAGSYLLTHYRSNGTVRYFTLYPRHLSELSGPAEVILGGESPVVEIVNAQMMSRGAKDKSLLIFGDAQAQSYLPFLAPNFAKITLVRTDLVDRARLEALRPDEYGQILFAYSVRSFVTENMSPKLSLLLEPEEAVQENPA